MNCEFSDWGGLFCWGLDDFYDSWEFDKFYNDGVIEISILIHYIGLENNWLLIISL